MVKIIRQEGVNLIGIRGSVYFGLMGSISVGFSTNRRVIIKTGVISRRTVELVLAKCEGVQVVQNVLGRIFGYGSIVVTTGGATNCYYYVANPFLFKRAINMQIG